MGVRLFVGNLDYSVNEGELREHFAPVGQPSQVALPVDLDGRTFVTGSNTANGDAGVGTRFEYRQRGARVWATYRGGRVRFGSLVAVGDRDENAALGR